MSIENGNSSYNHYCARMHPLRLQEVVTTLQTYFDRQFSGKKFWCQAEVMQAKQHKNRVYIDLVEYDTQGILVAKMKAIVWEYDLLAVYLQAHGLSSLQELVGKVIMFEAMCNFHAQWGLSLHVQALSHEFARGQLQIQQEQIRVSLREQGIYTANKETIFGLPPLRLAIISSVSSEGLRDFLTIIQQSGWKIEYELFSASIHGESAKAEVANQLQLITEQSDRFSAVIITRGGGGGEGLVRQNDQIIAESICRLPIPLILATGHTSDRSVLDEIVWYAAKTPSDAAHLIIDGVEQMEARLERIGEEITDLVDERLEIYRTNTEIRFEKIHQQGAFLRGRMLERVENRWSSITSLGPEQQLNRGYALVKDVANTYITKKRLGSMNKGDQINVFLYDKKIQVYIEEIYPL